MFCFAFTFAGAVGLMTALWSILAKQTSKLVPFIRFRHVLNFFRQLWAVLPTYSFWELPGKFQSLFFHYVNFAQGFPHRYQTMSEILRHKYQIQMSWTFSRQPRHFSVWLYRPLQWDQIHNRGALFQVPGCGFCGCVTSWWYHSSTVRRTEVIVALYR